jgi:peptide/nickel transport system permease protein
MTVIVTPAAGSSYSSARRASRQYSGLLRFILFKVGRAVLVVVAATMLTQALLNLTPGGLSAAILGQGATPAGIRHLNRQLGLDRPFLVQYAIWAGRALRGNLGTSPLTQAPVWGTIRQALPETLELVVLAVILSLFGAIVVALLGARRPGGYADRLGNVVSSLFLAVPTFVLAPVLVYFIAVRLRWFPVTGWTALSTSIFGNLHTAILPAMAVALPQFAVFQRILRGDLGAVLEEDYIDAARSRGISETRVLVRHAFRPASLSLLTVAGLSIGQLLGGTIIVEVLFALPGMGPVLQGAIIQHDLVVVQGFVVFFAATYVVLNLSVDLLYRAVDPRIRGAGS